MSSDPLFVGMTRPAMVLGVTYSGVALNLIAAVSAFVMLNSFWPLVAAIPIHVFQWALCRWEPRFFELIYTWAITKGTAKDRDIWKGSTYRP
jgi:type IV secretion system protein VirB3